MTGGGYGGGSAGGAFQFPFTQAGTYGYHCALHPPSAYPGFNRHGNRDAVVRTSP